MTSAPRLSLVLTPAELADRDLRHNRMRGQYRDLGFASVAEAQEFSDTLAAHAAGESVSPAFTAALKADQAHREAAAVKAAADAAAWQAQQRHAAAVERRDRAQQRLAIAKGSLAYLPQLRAEIAGLDWGRPQVPSDILAYGSTKAALKEAADDLRAAIPVFEAEAAAAQRDLDALTKAPTTAAKATGRN
jgi:hypothetical protein